MDTLPKCFVAYPYSPASRAETVENAIKLIEATEVVQIKGWKSLCPGGRPIITTILEEIRDCKCLIADVTELNPNVLFELMGDSIAKYPSELLDKPADIASVYLLVRCLSGPWPALDLYEEAVR